MQTHSKEGNARRYERLIAHTNTMSSGGEIVAAGPYRCARYRPQNRPRMHRRRDAVKRKRPTQHAPGVSEDKSYVVSSKLRLDRKTTSLVVVGRTTPPAKAPATEIKPPRPLKNGN